MTLLRIDLGSETPAYEQIASGIRAQLVSSQLQPGDPLPTVRGLAMDLGVHHNTVAEAYRLLAEEGWLDLRRGRGATVRDRPSPKPAPGAKARFAKRFEELAAKAIAEGVPRGAIAELADSLARGLREES
jgi:DNA-binding transcriptional regulator YhcF (GntR family)